MDAPCIIVLSTSKNAAALGSAGVARLASTSATAGDAAPASAALVVSFFVRRPIAASVATTKICTPAAFATGAQRCLAVCASDHPATQHRCGDHQDECATADERQVGTGVRQCALLRVRQLDDLGRLLGRDRSGGAVTKTDLGESTVTR